MKTTSIRFSTVIMALSACSPPQGTPGSSESAPGKTAPTSKLPTAAPVPMPAMTHPACIVSADCPSGQHCDLQQCVQDCNTQDPCTGQLTCSPRARCLSSGTPDVDPTPTGQSVGVLAASPRKVSLTDQDTSFGVTLTSSGTAPVRYRVEVSGPHLSVTSPTGTFTGSTKLTVKVDPSTVRGRNQPGTVTVYSTLGNTVINAPIHAGVTGSYKGRLQYDGGPINLGTSQVALDVIESKGAVEVRVDPQNSLLFPVLGGQAATGQGIYTVGSGLDVAVGQRVASTLGGADNPFARDIGRQVRFQVKPDPMGGLSGTFTETIVGLFTAPIKVTGHVAFQYVPQDSDPSFTLGTVPTMPPSPNKATAYSLYDVFAFTDAKACADVNLSLYDRSINASPNGYATPSLDSFFNQTPPSVGAAPSYNDISAVCQKVMAEASSDVATSDGATGCGVPQELAYALACGATTVVPSNVSQAKVVGRLVQDMLTGPLLVAKNEVVNALNQSFTAGPSAEMTHYTTAMTALAPYTKWALQPAVLEFVRSMSPQAAAGDLPTDTQTHAQPYPAGRALADLFSTMASIDAERVRIDAATAQTGATAHDTAQQRALLSFFRLAALSEILTQWGNAPETIGASFTAALTPLDQSFAGLLRGANAFGIPDGWVPFVYRPEQAGSAPTNFEQALTMAKSAVATEQADETAFTTEVHTYAAEVQQLKTELLNTKAQYDSQLHTLCGATFNPDGIKSPTNGWQSCGSNNAGTVGEDLLSVQSANAQLTTAQSGINGQCRKMQADVDALAQTDSIESSTINAVWQDGQQIAATDLNIGMIDAANQALSIAANAQVWNGGAPLAEAAIALITGAVKAQLTANRDQYQTDQQIQIQTAMLETGDIQAKTNITKDRIDLDQMVIAINQQEIGVLGAQAQVSNKVAQAQELWRLRAEQSQLTTQDPTKDPSYRTLRDSTAIRVLAERSAAQQSLYMAASGLAYELNTPIPNLAGAVINANNAASMSSLAGCLQQIFNTSLYAFGPPQDYVTTVSVRRTLGITGPRTDKTTGQMLSEGEQFRMLLLQNANLDGRGGVGIKFSTNLQPGNALWADDVCEDRIANVQAQLVGDFLGDNQAQVNVGLGGAGVIRSCGSDRLVAWSFGQGASSTSSAMAVIQAGVNTYGDAPPNASLFGQPVARANWVLVIPGGTDAPSNADVAITHIDDVVLKIDHKAIAQRSSPLAIDFSCLSNGGH